MKIPAYLTREGVFTYANADGSKRREYRPASEVFKADSLATLEDVELTDQHPTEMVTTANRSALSKGHVRSVKQDGTFVAGTVVVKDQGLIDLVNRGERKEISCGYTCNFDATPGTTPSGEHYDGVQRDITYNHAALGPQNWGRAGNAVALRLDGLQEPGAEPQERRSPMKIRIDGIEYEVGSDAHLQAQKKWDDKQAARITELEGQVTTEKKRADTAEARADKAEGDLKVRTDAEAAAKTAADRAALEVAARKVLGADAKFDGKSNDEIRRAVIEKADPSCKFDGKSADYIAVRFDLAVEGVGTPRTDTVGGANAALIASQHTLMPVNPVATTTTGAASSAPKFALSK